MHLIFVVATAQLTQSVQPDCAYSTAENPHTTPAEKFYCCTLQSLRGLETLPGNVTEAENDTVTMVRVAYPLVMRKIHENLFEHFADAEFLSVYATNLQEISKDDFEGATELIYLRLHSNPVRELFDHTFVHAARLRYINLGYNKLEILHRETFKGLAQLEQIHLNDNRLVMMHAQSFSGLPQLSVVNLKGNKCIKELFTLNPGSDTAREKWLESELTKRSCHRRFMEEIVQRTNGVGGIAIWQPLLVCAAVVLTAR